MLLLPLDEDSTKVLTISYTHPVVYNRRGRINAAFLPDYILSSGKQGFARDRSEFYSATNGYTDVVLTTCSSLPVLIVVLSSSTC